jgi:Zn-dependent peptidase ImmA (M78 family)
MENSYAPRRRFTLAHEIGHFCMHRATNQTTFIDTKATMNRSESYWNRFESEANNFAAELLMPADLIRSIGRIVIDKFKIEKDVEMMPMANFIEQMASRFKVSNPAMEFRLKNIGIRGKKPSK